MSNTSFYLGIDLGTSSIKGILRSAEGEQYKAKLGYSEPTPAGWRAAMRELIATLLANAGHASVAAVGFSSQVGTYVVDGKEVISWRTDAGREELKTVKSTVAEADFIREISMPHPDLISYPLPRLLYIQKQYGSACEVLMPKELMIRALTGETVTDIFSMRGVANLKNGSYAAALLERLGIHIKLPRMVRPTDLAGRVTAAAAAEFGIPAGTPVYLGCNDFFAGLLGLGIHRTGDAFDLSGTSEHVGYVSDEINPHGFVSGTYFVGNCTYGGTKASGASCDLAMKSFGIDGLSLDGCLAGKPPIFLPYLSGERAPIFDEQARGVFFGLDTATDERALAYATLEGVSFSLLDIAERMHMPTPTRLVCGGGSARDPLMNALRSLLFGCPVVTVKENDTSALGACMLAMVGNGLYPSIDKAIEALVQYNEVPRPDGKWLPLLKERFAIYREIYQNLKSTFPKFNQIYN